MFHLVILRNEVTKGPEITNHKSQIINQRYMKKIVFLLALLLMGATQMRADEGMWLPSEILKKI